MKYQQTSSLGIAAQWCSVVFGAPVRPINVSRNADPPAWYDQFSRGP